MRRTFHHCYQCLGTLFLGLFLVAHIAGAQSAPSDSTCRLEITANVDGATIYIDGKRAGLTPMEPLMLPPGTYEVLAEKEHHSSDRFTAVFSRPNQVVSKRLSLSSHIPWEGVIPGAYRTEPASNRVGRLVIWTERTGVEARVDGIAIAEPAPFTLKGVQPGEHVVTLIWDIVIAHDTVHVGRGERESINADVILDEQMERDEQRRTREAQEYEARVAEVLKEREQKERQLEAEILRNVRVHFTCPAGLQFEAGGRGVQGVMVYLKHKQYHRVYPDGEGGYKPQDLPYRAAENPQLIRFKTAAFPEPLQMKSGMMSTKPELLKYIDYLAMGGAPKGAPKKVRKATSFNVYELEVDLPPWPGAVLTIELDENGEYVDYTLRNKE